MSKAELKRRALAPKALLLVAGEPLYRIDMECPLGTDLGTPSAARALGERGFTREEKGGE